MSTQQQEAACRQAFNLYKKVRPDWKHAQWGGFFADEATHRDSRFAQREYGSLLLAATQPGDGIMCAKFDRMFASTIDACETISMIQERQFFITILDYNLDLSTAIGQCLFKVMAAFKELDVQEIRQRTRDALSHRRKVGLPVGQAPVGWSSVAFNIRGVVRKFYVIDYEARALGEKILAIQKRYRLNKAETMRQLERMGIKNPSERSKGKWTAPAVARWLAAARNKFPLPNGEHEALAPPPDAEPVRTISAYEE